MVRFAAAILFLFALAPAIAAAGEDEQRDLADEGESLADELHGLADDATSIGDLMRGQKKDLGKVTVSIDAGAAKVEDFSTRSWISELAKQLINALIATFKGPLSALIAAILAFLAYRKARKPGGWLASAVADAATEEDEPDPKPTSPQGGRNGRATGKNQPAGSRSMT